MTKEKISATVDPVRLAAARSVSSADSVSGVRDEALSALIEREHERRWLEAHPHGSTTDDLPSPISPDLNDLPWDD